MGGGTSQKRFQTILLKQTEVNMYDSQEFSKHEEKNGKEKIFLCISRSCEVDCVINKQYSKELWMDKCFI